LVRGEADANATDTIREAHMAQWIRAALAETSMFHVKHRRPSAWRYACGTAPHGKGALGFSRR
ncbi:hypothetical protein AB0A73_10915, partial [Glycomyces sp. NPDC047369]